MLGYQNNLKYVLHKYLTPDSHKYMSTFRCLDHMSYQLMGIIPSVEIKVSIGV